MLIATDFSLHAEQALARAANLPLARGACIQLVHVLADGERGSTADRKAESALELQWEKLAAALPGSSAPRITASVVSGMAWMEIVRAARAQSAELVVIGSHSKRGSLFPLGSTARDVIRRGSSPVLVVRTPPTRGYRRPLVAVDLSDVSRSVLETALLILDEDVPVRVLYAYQVPFEGYMGNSSRSELLAVRRHYRGEARQRLSALVASLEVRGAPFETSVRRGEAFGAIVREIERRVSDVIVVGTHGRTGLSRAILGSVAGSLLDHAPCDVLIGRPERFPIASD